MSGKVTLGLCICTMNRPEDLREALGAVLAADDPPERVLVSDDTPAGDVADSVRAVAESFAGVVYQAGPRKGLGPNRNACLRALMADEGASVDWVLFIDDDVKVPGDHFVRVRERLAVAEGKTIVSGGEHKHRSDGREPVWTEPARVGFWGTQTAEHDGDPNAIVINATAFPMGLFRSEDGRAGAAFDERLKYGCEEIDVCRQAIARGYRIAFEPGWWVDHYPAPSNRESYDRVKGASYIYATLKGHLLIDRRPLRFLAFALFGPARSVLQRTRRQGPRAGWRALVQSLRGFGLLGLEMIKNKRPV